MTQKFSPGHLASALLDAKEFAQELPGRLNRFLELLAKNEVKVRVDAIDETASDRGVCRRSRTASPWASFSRP